MESIEEIKARIKSAIGGVQLEVISNASPSAQVSIAVDRSHAVAVAEFLRDDPALRFDFCSNVTGVDWLDRTTKETVKTTKTVDGKEEETFEVVERTVPGHLEAVYHLYSIAHRHGPLILRIRTEDRQDRAVVPSLTSIWRAAEFQEREIFDLYGIVFDGHPDLRRILMWDEFVDFPMRKDYSEPDDYEYEPTPHGDVLDKSRAHYSKPTDS